MMTVIFLTLAREEEEGSHNMYNNIKEGSRLQ